MTVRLDFKASVRASQGKAASKLQAAKTPWAPPGLSALVSDEVVFEVDVGDGTVAFQGICECLSGKAWPGSSYRISGTRKLVPSTEPNTVFDGIR